MLIDCLFEATCAVTSSSNETAVLKFKSDGDGIGVSFQLFVVGWPHCPVYLRDLIPPNITKKPKRATSKAMAEVEAA